MSKKKESSSNMFAESEESAESRSLPLEPGELEQATTQVHHHDHDDYVHTRLVKMGVARLDRRPVRGVQGNPKKEGHGGKFTWMGPTDEGYDDETAPAAIDEGDPNFVDASDEARDSDQVVAFADVAKMAGPQGVSRIDVVHHLPLHDPHANLARAQP